MRRPLIVFACITVKKTSIPGFADIPNEPTSILHFIFQSVVFFVCLHWVEQLLYWQDAAVQRQVVTKSIHSLQTITIKWELINYLHFQPVSQPTRHSIRLPLHRSGLLMFRAPHVFIRPWELSVVVWALKTSCSSALSSTDLFCCVTSPQVSLFCRKKNHYGIRLWGMGEKGAVVRPPSSSITYFLSHTLHTHAPAHTVRGRNNIFTESFFSSADGITCSYFG